MKRRAFLQLLAATPIAALAPWRPPAAVTFHGLPIDAWQQAYIDWSRASSDSLWLIVWNEQGVEAILPRPGFGA